MKKVIFALLLLSLCTGIIYAQSGITKVVIKDEVYYLTRDIGFPITGTYKYEGKEPIVYLGEDGNGLFQLHEMGQTPMIWGIECQADGTPMKQEVDFGAIYILWYQITEKHQGKSWESGTVGEWDAVQFSIHPKEHEMFILGERIKSY